MSIRKLRTCDFCGEEATGIYEVLPEELSPTEAEQRRVVLCDDCSETLEYVVDPLLARLRGERSAAERTEGLPEERSASPEPVPAAPDSDERGGAERRERPLDPSASDRPADETPMTESGPGEPRSQADEYVTREAAAGGTPDGGTDDAGDEVESAAEDYEVEDAAEDAEEPPRAHVDASDAPAAGDSSADAGDEVEAAAEDYEVEDAAEDADEPPRAHVDASDAPAADDPSADADAEIEEERPSADYEVDEPDRKRDADDESPAEDYEVVDDTDETPVSDEVGNDGDAAEAEPPKFRKVMRLLNNREFPVDREEFTDLASGAYDIDRSRAAEIIDYAIQRDVLTEENGQLRRA